MLSTFLSNDSVFKSNKHTVLSGSVSELIDQYLDVYSKLKQLSEQSKKQSGPYISEYASNGSVTRFSVCLVNPVKDKRNTFMNDDGSYPDYYYVRSKAELEQLNFKHRHSALALAEMGSKLENIGLNIFDKSSARDIPVNFGQYYGGKDDNDSYRLLELSSSQVRPGIELIISLFDNAVRINSDTLKNRYGTQTNLFSISCVKVDDVLISLIRGGITAITFKKDNVETSMVLENANSLSDIVKPGFNVMTFADEQTKSGNLISVSTLRNGDVYGDVNYFETCDGGYSGL